MCKRVCYETVRHYEQLKWRERLNESSDFSVFIRCHDSLKVFPLWTVVKLRPECFLLMKFLASILCKSHHTTPEFCSNCNQLRVNKTEHMLFECPCIDSARFSLLSVTLGSMRQELPRHAITPYLFDKIDDTIASALNVEKSTHRS